MTRLAGRWRTAALVGAGAIVIGSVAVALALPRAEAVRPATNPNLTTTTVSRETLVDVRTVRGRLAYGAERSAESRLDGTVTWLPAVGTTVDRGKALFRIDDKPVVLLFGELPAYRDLTAGAPPANQPGVAPTDKSGPDTSAPDKNGPDKNGPDNNGPDRSGAAAGGNDANVSGDKRGAGEVTRTKGADVRLFEENLHALGYSGFTVDDEYTPSTASAVRRWQKDVGLPQTGVVELGRVFYASGQVRVATHKLAVGKSARGDVLTYTGTTRTVTATLKPKEQRLAARGTKVTVALASGKEVAGTVTAVRPASVDDKQGDGEPSFDADIELSDPAAVNGPDDGSVKVRFVIEQRRDVLVVPVAALLGLAEGGHGLEVVENGATRIVVVNTGLFADGKVEISGSGVREGMTVGTAP